MCTELLSKAESTVECVEWQKAKLNEEKGKKGRKERSEERKTYTFHRSSSREDNPLKPHPWKFAMSFASKGNSRGRKQRARKKRAHGRPSSLGRNS